MSKDPSLFIVATPIGNLEDFTFRAVRTLSEVDIIACEDTRHTVKLLNHYKISCKLESYHQHNMYEKGPKLIQLMQEGKKIAVVSDAGTPGISDPGAELIKLANEHGIGVTMIPGAVAGIMGLVLSGMDSTSFVFEGFLPAVKKNRQIKLQEIALETRTIVVYEAPHRLIKTLKELLQFIGNRNFVFARELTKKFEEVRKFTLEEGIEFFKDHSPKGEFVIVIQGRNSEDKKNEDILEWEKLSVQKHFELYLNSGMERNDAMKLVAKDRGLHKRDVYSELIKKD